VFLSVSQLEQEMGVDKRIGRFFVDRKIPDNNSFWKGRLLYIAFGNGYLSIPVYYDILYRIGVPVEILLEEKHIEFMEQLMHFAILQERNEITVTEELTQIRLMLKPYASSLKPQASEGRVRNMEYYLALNRYLDQPTLNPMGPFGLPFPSLNRADVFLYILCDLPLTETQWALAIRFWYALHPSYLIIDDIRDYETDRKNGDENVIVDFGGGATGVEKTFELFRENCGTLREINPLLGDFLLGYEERLRENIPINS
jgi:hypothetical protein